MNTTDKEWEKLGKTDPYFGVIVEEKFKTKNLTQQNLELFFDSGERYADNVFNAIENAIGEKFNPEAALDFGCGVGRLTIPLSKRCKHIVGVDISESILKEARTNSEKFGTFNTVYKGYSEKFIVANRFDFINTYVVLQHILVKTGNDIIGNLLTSLSEGGIAVIHVTFSETDSKKMQFRKYFNVLAGKSVVVNGLYKIVRRIVRNVNFFTPVIQMNYYDLNIVLRNVYDSNCTVIGNEFTNHGGSIGSILFVRKGIASKYKF